MENQVNGAPMEPVGPTAGGAWQRPWAAFNIIERPGLRSRIWSRVGTAWLNRDGSINVVLDSFPLGGKVNLRPDERERGSRVEERGALRIAADSTEEHV